MKSHRTKAAADVDAYVGRQIRQRRILAGMTQETLAAALGVSFQQLQKYETGKNRISAGRLYRLAGISQCMSQDFFPTAAPEAVGQDAMRRQTIILVRCVEQMPEAVRKPFLELVRDVAG